MASRAVHIRLKDELNEVVLAWERFDGDDCFEDFRITVIPLDADVRVYEFGPCAVRAVRKMKLFLSDKAQQSISGGFRHPDIRTYDWERRGSDLTLVVKLEGSGLTAEHVVKTPVISIVEDAISYD
jgi:hypothetical protein